jgi:hypothetical protein
LTGEAALDLPFTDGELVQALKTLNSAAAVGPQCIPSTAIKEVFRDDSARPVLLSLMNRCWSEGSVPSCWGEAEIFILYKGKGVLSL